MKKCLRRSENRGFPLPMPQTVLGAEMRDFTHSDTVLSPFDPLRTPLVRSRDAPFSPPLTPDFRVFRK
jgi:hypothetical protein